MMQRFGLIFLMLLLAWGIGWAQRRSGWGWPRHVGPLDTGIVYTEPPYRVPVDVDTVRTAREIATHSTETPVWTNIPAFAHDVFTFARIIYRRAPYGPGMSDSYSPWGWLTDFPDSDLNLSYRLQQVTSIKVDPNGRVLRLTDPALFDFPWIYMVEPGGLQLKEEEVPILRKYLLNGGFLMADDFWGEVQWANFYRQIKRVFPEREFNELPMEHPIFHSVFDLIGPKNKLQIPNIGQGRYSLIPGSPEYGVTWELHDGEECTELHVRAMFDDKGQMMILATHNTDNGDGWEREGEDEQFFREFSEKKAYPLAINIIFYTMTH